jgi:hypothetical protein
MQQITKALLERKLAAGGYLHFEHKTIKNKDGSRLRARANGAMKTWKTYPNKFSLPIKQGLHVYAKLTEENMNEWELV